MSRFSDTVRDELQRPIPGVLVYVYDWNAPASSTGSLSSLLDDDGVTPLANPLVTDQFGQFYFNASDGTKLIEFHFGGKLQYREQVILTPAGAYPGNDATIRADLAAPGGAGLIEFGASESYPTGTVGDRLKAVREKLSADRTYYVRNDGSDAHTGLANTAAGAFLTLQKAVDTVFGALDLNGHNVTVQAADGARTAGFSIIAPQVGQGDIFILGNVAAPANCPVSVSGTDAFHVSNGATIWLRGFKPTTTTSGAGVLAYNCATINMQAMDFGSCAASQIECGQGSTIVLDGAYSISGGAVSHWHVGSFGLIAAGTFTVTITGTPAFSSYFAGVAQGNIVVPGVTFSGSATGPRYLAHHGGLIRAAGIDPAFPGSIEGLANSGGIYIASVVNPWVIAPDLTINNSVSVRGYNTGSGVQTERFVTRSDANASGNFYCNGDNSYSSGETWFGNTQRTIAGDVSAQDGATFYSKASIATGTFPVAEMSSKGQPCIRLGRRTSDGTILLFHRDTAGVGSISVTTTATAYNTSSDYRLKEDPQPINNALARLGDLKPYNFAWKLNGERTDGFFAHEVATVIPQAVTGEKDATDEEGNPVYQAVDQSKIVPLLVAAVQELSAEVSALKGGAA